MSYCRWSNDDYSCDLYVFADVEGGITIHVANNKIDYCEPLPPYISIGEEGWYERHEKVTDIVRRSERRCIGLEYDGMSWYNLEGESAVERLTELLRVGYTFPVDIIDDIKERFCDDF